MRYLRRPSTCFSSFELLYGRQPQGLMDLMLETWEQTLSYTEGCSSMYSGCKNTLSRQGPLQENLRAAYEAQTQGYNQTICDGDFETPWHEQDELLVTPYPPEPELRPQRPTGI